LVKMKSAYFPLIVLLFGSLLTKAEEHSEQAFYSQAVDRLVVQHDAELPIAIGALVVKQAGLIIIREELEAYGVRKGFDASWSNDAGKWKKAEKLLIKILDRIIDTKIKNPNWVHNALYQAILNGITLEEVEAISAHFQTDVGSMQRQIIDMSIIAETLQLAYTISRTIDIHLKGSEREYKNLQQVWWERKPEFGVNKKIYADPAVREFAGQETGRKYGRLISMQGIGGMMSYIRDIIVEVQIELSSSIKTIDGLGRGDNRIGLNRKS